jgi:putative ABC transport system permease protein
MGVLWGSTGIVVLLAWGSGFQAYMHSELGRYGPPMLFVIPGVTSSGFPGHRSGVRVEISREDAAAAERASPDLVEAILPEHVSPRGERALLRAGGRVRRLDVSGVDERYARLRGFRIGLGRFFDVPDLARRRPVAVLGHEAAEELFGEARAALGKRIRVDGHPFKVLGVADRKGRQYYNTNRPDNRLLMVPITTAETLLGYREESVERLSVFPRAEASGRRTIEAVLATIAPRAGFHPEDTDAVRWFDLSDLLRLVDRICAGFLLFTGTAGTVTLLVAGVGIANFHLASLAERTVEIGVARALGARASTLVAQTLLESLLVSGTAALLGVAAGVAGCEALARLAPPGVFPTPVISGTAIGVTFVALVGVATVAAAVPALRVRRMEVAAALRSTP